MANEWYAIANSAVALAALTASGNSNLDIQPHPTEYHEEFEIVGTSGEGKPIAVGYPWCTWTYDVPLSAAQWGELMDFVGTAASASVWIRTRTNQITVDNKYQYKNYACIMHRPTGKSRARYSFEGVEIKFTQLVEV